MLLQLKPELENGYSRTQFDQIFQAVNSTSDVTLGRVLDVVLNNLTLSPGEYRLIGATDQRLGHNVFDPESTQVDQQTLVVTHLKQPQLPLAEPDKNAYEDFASGRSNLDQEWDEKEFEEILRQQNK